MRNIALAILFISFFLFSCEKEENYSELPSISFKDFRFEVENTNNIVNQIGYLTFNFVDGNGDIGFYENSDPDIDIEIKDVFIYSYIKQNGSYSVPDTVGYLLPYFEAGVYKKYIKGEMEIKIYLLNQVSDTVKYEFQIMDREYHLSNIETTPELIVPEWN